ncbi:TPA: Myb-like DNA-binding domain-containing protein [Salmonella enterica subsp. enterica serovar Muenchen]|nr:AsnC family protein [Salmonella enterica]HAF5675580.1 AsnC family protein [Salmonella enterica]
MPMILPPMGTPGKCPAHIRPWTPEEDELLVNLHGKKTTAEIAARLPTPGRTISAIKTRMTILRKRFPGRLGHACHLWTPKDDHFLRRNRHTMTAKEIGNRLTPRRTESAVMTRAIRLGISLYKCGDNWPYTRFKDEDVKLLRELRDQYGLTFKEIGEKFYISKDIAGWLYRHRHTADEAIAREFLPR